ncbi:hypothetical protein MMC26_000474 [Xylographa opegraphella]|nr:hypothetical protein [Xylographa opegraphella]
MNRQTLVMQATPREDLPTFLYSVFVILRTSVNGRLIYRNNSGPRDLSVGNDLAESLASSESTLIDDPTHGSGHDHESQEFDILDLVPDSDDEEFLVDADEFFGTGDTGDMVIVDAGPAVETEVTRTAEKCELLADALREEPDFIDITVECLGIGKPDDAAGGGKSKWMADGD